MTTIYEVAKKARTTSGTVSRALNNKGYVAEETKRKIERVAKRLNYTPHFLARSLRTKKTDIIAVIIPNIANPIYPEIIRGIQDKAHELGYQVLISNSDALPEREIELLTIFSQKRVDGIFLGTGEGAENKKIREKIKKLSEAGIKLVVGGFIKDKLPTDSLSIDNFQGAYEVTKHLLNLGHNKIGFISGPKNARVAQERQKGYRAALLNHNILYHDGLVAYGNFQQESGYTLGKDFLQREKAPSAIFAANDVMAIGVILAAEELGRRIPEEVAIAGFDDITWASIIRPRLTTVSQPKYEVGSLAAEMLIQRINEENNRTFQRIILKPKVVIRESTLNQEKK